MRLRILWLAIIFLFVVALRLLVSFQQDLPDYSAYDSLRQVESIQQTGLPLFHDNLAYGGRDAVVTPLFYYVLSIFSLFIPPILLVKIVPNILASLVIFPAFYLTRLITNKEKVSLITAAMTGLVPAAFFVGVNDASSFSLSIPLLVTASYLFHKSRKSGRHLNWLLVVLAVLPLIDATSIILLFALLIYALLLRLERIPYRPKERDITLFFIFYIGWVMLVLFKRAFITHGPKIIKQNIPAAEISKSFSALSLPEAMISTGIIPLLAGVVGLYLALSGRKKKSLVLVASFLITVSLLLWIPLIPWVSGVYILSTFLALSSGFAFAQLEEYFKSTKFPWMATTSLVIIFVLFLALVIPLSFSSITGSSPTHNDVSALATSSINGTIIAPPKEGSFVAYITKQPVVMTDSYLLISRVEERYDDIEKFYSLFFVIDALDTMQKYGARYAFFSSEQKELPRFVTDDCFKTVSKSNSSILYQRLCGVDSA